MRFVPAGSCRTAIRPLARTTRRILALAIVLSAFCVAIAHGQDRGGSVVGRRLADVLRTLQTQGVRLVFSSKLVTPDMRVAIEPRATGTRQRLAELLAPHGLEARTGPGGIIEIVRRKHAPAPVSDSAPRSTAVETDRGAGAIADAVYRERVTVTADEQRGPAADQATSRHLSAEMLDRFGSRIADDPLRTLQVMPGVATGDDFRSALSIRGSAFRQTSVIVDGVEAPWLQHAGPARPDAATMTMLRGDVLEEATLHVGAYARRDSSQLGPQLDLTLREGSRAGTRLQAAVSGTSTTLTAEGPLGGGDGSWLIGGRHGNAEWPLGRSDHQGTLFGFSDLQSKIAYDVSPRHHVTASVVAGLSRLDRDSDDRAALAGGINHAALASVTLRSLVGARTVIKQQASTVDHAYGDSDAGRQTVDRGGNRATAFRLDVTREIPQGLIQTGGQLRRVRGSRVGQLASGEPDALTLAWSERSAYAAWRWIPTAQLMLVPAARVVDVSLTGRPAIDRTLEAEWRPGREWLLHGSAGIVHQSPEFTALAYPSTLSRHQRAAQFDLGLSQQLTSQIRWDVTGFARRERDVLREPDFPNQALHAGPIGSPGHSAPSGFDGVAHGVELMVERRDTRGPSGWVSYAYAVAQQVDPAGSERFRADYDQRHTLNVAAFAPIPGKMQLSVVFRAGSNFPLRGYFVERRDGLFQGSRRNTVSLPAYARLDLRAERPVERGDRRMTLFVEALNVLDRRNAGIASGTIVEGTGQAIGFTERLFPRLITAGIRLGF